MGNLNYKRDSHLKLFDLQVDKEKRHKNFVTIVEQSTCEDREELERWCEGFPDRDKKLVKEFQTTFNSSFWEIYLYQLLKKLDFEFDWSYSRPDFLIRNKDIFFNVEATIASSAAGKKPEWEKDLNDGFPTRFREMNIESIIRLSNAISKKYSKYKEDYSKLEHVKGNPFILALAPFEQPHFNMQCDVPMMALLYNYYVDEDSYKDNPSAYPHGPEGIALDYVEKDNGSKVTL